MSAGGVIESSVTLDEVFTVLGAKRVPLAPELAGYLVLEIAEHADPTGGDVDPRTVFVGEEGTVALVKPLKPRRDPAGGDVEASVRAVLARLLDASGSQTPALAAASKRKSGGGLPALAAELETALIPVNRAAGRRALARLAREVRRILLGVGRNALPSSSDSGPPRRPLPPARGPSSEPARSTAPLASTFARDEEPTTTRQALPSELLPKAASSEWPDLPTTQFEVTGRDPSPSQADVDALIDQFGVTTESDHQQARALKAIAGLEPTPPPPVADEAPTPHRTPPLRAETLAEDAAQVESLLAMPSSSPEKRSVPAERSPETRQLPTQPSLRRSRSRVPSDPAVSAKKRSGLAPLFGLVAIAVGSFAAWELRPSAVARSPAPAGAPIEGQAAPGPVCNATLVITNVPPHAEVLLREGQAPVDVEKMPVGARLEFVATAEGYAPKRVVVPAGGGWDSGPDGKPRFEAAVQLDKSTVKSLVDTWPFGEPGAEVGGQGPPGTVHVVATPRGAEILDAGGDRPRSPRRATPVRP